MAAGKTTVGRLLGSRLGWHFIDADDEIESTVGLSVAEIFRTQGESSFRSYEHTAIVRLLAIDSLVLAMGGGAIEDNRTLDLLRTTPGTRLVYLEASLETALKRCGPIDDSSLIRPVLGDQANLQARYQRRLPLYRQSHNSVQVDDLSPECVADAILVQLNLTPASQKT